MVVKLASSRKQNLKHVLKGLIKFVVDDANMCVNFSTMNRSRLTLAVTKLQPAGKRKQGPPLERLLGYIETETGHEAKVLENRIIIIIIITTTTTITI
jgi:hypothetical protein